jgi:hypothetical protein
VFRALNPTVVTEGCVAWKGDNSSAALKGYVQIVEQVACGIRRASPQGCVRREVW